MKKIIFTGILVIAFFRAGLVAQQVLSPAELGIEPSPLSADELFVLSAVPLLELPERYKGQDAPLIPVFVDNSVHPYFRPITTQSGYECGQSAGVAFNFTYEIDRVRNLPANVIANQYPTHFTWDFLNGGYNYTGASFFDSWEIVRVCGNMNVADYGGTLNYGGEKRWISGYNVWYNGMKNRLNSVKAIRVDNPEGLQTLKYWLYDHLENSPVGGVANFYAKYYSSVGTTLPPGTPEAGKYVQTNWGPSPSHAWTVCGYHDSIRFDYNNDGLYTNNLDITGDAIVDMHDWEIGGLKYANGYAGTGWCNSGYCYLMYKTLADNIGYGGIWNHTVYVLDVKETCDPRLTMKVTLKHVSRDKLKVTVGMNTNLSATIPMYVYEYPVFNYQGGGYYMQGGTTEEDKTIEFGLDITPILSRLTNGQPAKYFLQVEENDPGNSFSGEIVQCALVDYTYVNPVTYPFPSTNVTLLNNTMTRISKEHTVFFSKPAITTVSLPEALLYQPYTFQLTAAGGTPPYLWDVQLEYPEQLSTAVFPTVSAQQLTLTNNNTGYALKTLDFPFPFFDKEMNTLYIYADGYILFDDQPYTWPYLVDKNLLFRQTTIISPFMTDLTIYPAQGDGIWYEGDATSATIRWKASIYNMAGSSAVNVAVKFYPNGTLEFYYGNMNYPVSTQWTGGISGGDNRNYQLSQLNNSSTISSGALDKFTACGYPVEMNLSEDGIFSGTPQYPYFNQPIKFRVTDNNGISNTKVLNFTTIGLLLDFTIEAGGDTLIEYGDTATIDLSLNNLGSQPVTNVNTWITESDPYITLLDSVQYIGNIGAGMTINVANAFAFKVSSSVPDQHPFSLTLHETSVQQNFETVIDLIALAPVISPVEIVLNDGDNGRLDPGETSDMTVTFGNTGSAKVTDLSVQLSTTDPFLTINQASGMIPVLYPDSSFPLVFNVSASSQAPFEHLYTMPAWMTGSKNFSATGKVCLFSGEIVEDYETGTFFKFPWSFGGYAPWNIDQYSPYEGSYCAKSGWIFDEEESVMFLTVNVLAAGQLSFWKWVSCENDPNGANFDYLAFYIDGEEMGRWDGLIPWSKEVYDVPTGIHTFKWIYSKDGSVSANFDCAYIDFIILPPFEGAFPSISVWPSSFSHSVDPGQTVTDLMQVTNAGGGLLNYTVMVFDTSANKHEVTDNLAGSMITCSAGSFVPGESFNWTFTLTNASADNEYIRHVVMEFPEGVSVISSTNFSGGSLGDLITDGVTGNGITLNWHGESSGGRGVLKPGETAAAIVAGTIDEPYTFDVFLVYVIQGDNYGIAPHSAPDEIRIANSGLLNSWLTFDPPAGALLTEETEDIAVYFDATSLSPGNYICDILVRDPSNNIVTVPVTLQVKYPVGTKDPGSGLLSLHPNPFRERIAIDYYLPRASGVSATIFDLNGHCRKRLYTGTQAAGDHRIIWNGEDDGGTRVPDGIYMVRIETDSQIYSGKVVFISN